MANSTSNLDLISPSQANKEVTANALFDAASPALLYGRRASTTVALTWGYYGGMALVGDTPTPIANGTVTLTPSATNYIEASASTGAVSVNTTGFTAGAKQLYAVVAGATTVTGYTDYRTMGGGGGVDQAAVDDAIAAHEGALDPHPQYLTQAEADTRYDAAGAASTAVAAHEAASDPHAQYQRESEKGAANGYAGLGSDGKVPSAQLPASATSGGTVTSVALTTPGILFNVSGSPVTGDGTLAITLKTQAKNTVLAGPASGADATPTMRSITPADLPVMVASGASHAAGIVPDPGSTAGNTKYLREDGTWAVPPGSSSGGTPGGATTQVQFNDGGTFAGDDGLTWDKTNNILYVGTTTAPGIIQGAANASGVAAAIKIKGGNSSNPGSAGGKVTIVGGDGGNAASGGVDILGGESSNGAGNVLVAGGTISGGTAGNVTVRGGDTGGSSTGGSATLRGGDSAGSPGDVTVRGGDALDWVKGGSVTIRGGNSLYTSVGGSTPPGTVTITGGAASGNTNNAAGGAVTVQGGQGGASSGAGGTVTIKAGSPQADNGGSVNIQGSAGVGTNKNGGNVVLTPGAATGSGTPGNVVLNGSGAALSTSAIGGFTCLPTCAGTPTGSPAGVPTGCVAMVVDTTNLKFYIYLGGAWKSATLA